MTQPQRRTQPDWEAIVRHNEALMRQSTAQVWDSDFETVQGQLRHLRETENKDPSSTSSSSSSSLPPSLPSPSESLERIVMEDRHRTRNLNVLRVSQLDASLLDGEVQNILKSRLLKAFSFFRPGWVHSIKPELELSLQLMIWWLSIWKEGATYGQRLQNLSYRNEKAAAQDPVARSLPLTHLFPATRSQRFLYALIAIVGQWAFSRFEKYTLAQDWARAEVCSFFFFSFFSITDHLLHLSLFPLS